MCKPASFVLTKDCAYWSKTSDSHEDIIHEYKLHADGARGPNILRVEITPPNGDLSLPLEQWVFKIDQDILPKWAENKTDCEPMARKALIEWSKSKLSDWNVYEAFHAINPLNLKCKRISEKRMIELLRQWAGVRDSVRDSVWDSVWAGMWDSVWDSVWAGMWDSVWDSVWAGMWNSVGDSVGAGMWDSVGDSVWDSVGDSVWAYTGSLFVPRIKSWKYAESLGENPWKPLTELWYAGYVPSFDGKTWRLHAGKNANVVFQIEASKLKG